MSHKLYGTINIQPVGSWKNPNCQVSLPICIILESFCEMIEAVLRWLRHVSPNAHNLLEEEISRTKTEVFSNGLTKDAHVVDIFLAPWAQVQELFC